MNILLSNIMAIEVALPMLCALFCVFLKNHPKLSSYLSIACTTLCFLISISMIMSYNGSMSYEYGNWEAPIGIEHRTDLLSLIINLIINSSALLSSILLLNFHKIDISKKSIFNGMFLLCISGMIGMVLTGDIFNFYVFLEIASLSTYGLIGAINNRRSAFASLKYVIIGTVAASFIVFGIGFIYMKTGSLNMQDLHLRIPEIMHHNTILFGAIMIILGLLIKIALFPMHGWLADVYRCTSYPILMFFSSVTSKVMLYGLIRFIYDIFDHRALFSTGFIQQFLQCIAIISMIYGSLKAYRQTDFKRLLAFSTISQMGLLSFAVFEASAIALASSLMLMINHSISKSSLFLAASNIEEEAGSCNLNKIHLIARYMPKTSFIVLINIFSLIGIPLTFGFMAKWHFLSSIINNIVSLDGSFHEILIISLVVISSTLTMAYSLKLIESIYFKNNQEKTSVVKERINDKLIVMSILLAINFIFMIYSSNILEICNNAIINLNRL